MNSGVWNYIELSIIQDIYEKLTNDRYKGTPIETLVRGNKQKTRTIFLAQNGMLECGRNMKGAIPEICPECNETDDEQHRLSSCKKWSSLNNSHDNNVHFHDIYSEDEDTLNRVLSEISKIWETRFANGRMKKWFILSFYNWTKSS